MSTKHDGRAVLFAVAELLVSTVKVQLRVRDQLVRLVQLTARYRAENCD